MAATAERKDLEAFNASPRYRDELRATAAKLVAPGKGLLACDEPPNVLPQRMKQCWTSLEECDAAWRCGYRELMFTTPGLSRYVSGVILNEETVDQTMQGVSATKLLSSLDIVPGVKLDGGFAPMPGDPTQWRTAGLDALDAKCKKAKAAGCAFAKWRAPLKVDFTEAAVAAEADALACYAKICQDNGLVPIVEPDVVMDGAHGIVASARATKTALVRTFAAMDARGVDVRGSVIKTNMVRPGAAHAAAEDVDLVGAATVRVFADALPASLPGVVFLSGGMSEAFATNALAAINRDPGRAACPFPLSFSYGRALQQSCRDAWQGKAANKELAQTALLDRARRNSEATKGISCDDDAATTSLHVAGGNRY